MWKEFWTSYGKRTIGAAIGLFFGIIYLFAGFWDMLMVGLLVAIGYWFGKQKELHNDPLRMLQQLWSVLMERVRFYK
ncbi:DUF2273 domain-containing protein [Paenibacillus protaetiae]|uniref:DUF2273 domain-containing protein n=1 Tax=Paenibacillus protaetiae TaxID=2509456 RepID=A0A4P6ETL3_9BACL|nr:DUF2273 domain-containing protein [Paenibacillus protaetiae]QAY66244.1 DUF2273 domain-containing protein [Paenibacillus protaetiae]